MRKLYRLTKTQLDRLKPFLPKSRGKPRVDDPLPGSGLAANRERGKVLSGMIFIQRKNLMWKHAPWAHGPSKALYNRWKP